MNRAMRFSSAAVGMVLLAGLAYYQGDVDPTLGQEGALVGTALAEPADTDDSDCVSTPDLDPDGCTEIP